jgi:hypothetical protein
LTAPRSYIITSSGDPSSVDQDLLPTIPVDTIPRLDEVVVAPKRARFIASNIKSLTNWRALFELLSSAPLSTKPKLLTHSGHGNVSIMLSDITPGRDISPSTARITIKRITRAPCLGRHRMSSRNRCLQCGLATGTCESLEHHSVRCPHGGMRQMMHASLVGVLRSIFRDVGIPYRVVVTKARRLRSADATKLGDVVALDFFAEGRH